MKALMRFKQFSYAVGRSGWIQQLDAGCYFNKQFTIDNAQLAISNEKLLRIVQLYIDHC